MYFPLKWSFVLFCFCLFFFWLLFLKKKIVRPYFGRTGGATRNARHPNDDGAKSRPDCGKRPIVICPFKLYFVFVLFFFGFLFFSGVLSWLGGRGELEGVKTKKKNGENEKPVVTERHELRIKQNKKSSRDFTELVSSLFFLFVLESNSVSIRSDDVEVEEKKKTKKKKKKKKKETKMKEEEEEGRGMRGVDASRRTRFESCSVASL